MKSQLKKSGFTLTEVLIVIGIFTLIIGLSFTLLSTGKLSVYVSEAQVQAQERSRQAMGKISRELRLSQSNKVFISDSVGMGTNQDSGSVLNFQIPVGSYDSQLDLKENNSIKWGSDKVEGDFIAYYLNDNNELVRLTGDGSEQKIIATNISSLNFSQETPSSSLIYIEVESQGQSASKTATQTLQTEVRLRN